MDFALNYLAGVLLVMPILAEALLKGKKRLALCGLFLGPLGVIAASIGAVRIAKPGSWWARRYYDEPKTRLAHSRFPEKAEAPPADSDPGARAHYRCTECGLITNWAGGLTHYEQEHPAGPAAYKHAKHP